jgi:hypothetical protein
MPHSQFPVGESIPTATSNGFTIAARQPGFPSEAEEHLSRKLFHRVEHSARDCHAAGDRSGAAGVLVRVQFDAVVSRARDARRSVRFVLRRFR